MEFHINRGHLVTHVNMIFWFVVMSNEKTFLIVCFNAMK